MSIWVGDKVRLRAFEPADGAYNFESWNDTETLKNRDVPKFPTSKHVASYFAGKDAENGPLTNEYHLIIENIEGEVVGDIGTGECDARNGTFMLGLEIRTGHRRKGYATEAVLLVLRYYFYALRYNKAWTGIYSFNESSLKLFRKIGFEEEGLQKEMVFLNGRYHDKMLVGLTADRFDSIYNEEYKI